MLEDYKILLYLDCKQGIKIWVPIGIVAVEGIKWFVWHGIWGVPETYKKTNSLKVTPCPK